MPIDDEGRRARIELPGEKKLRIDAAIEALAEDEAEAEPEWLKRKWARVEALLGAEKRLRMVAEDRLPISRRSFRPWTARGWWSA